MKKKLKDITISELRRFCHNRGANCWKYPTCPIFEIDGCFGETLNDLEQEVEIPEVEKNE